MDRNLIDKEVIVKLSFPLSCFVYFDRNCNDDMIFFNVLFAAPTVPPPAPGQSAVPQPTAAYSNTYPANGYPAPMPGAQYPPPQQPPMGAYGYPGQTAYPAYPPGGEYS